MDSFHTLSLGDDPAGLADVPGERIFFVQLADAPKLSMDVLNWSRHFRNFPGQGDLDVTGFLRAVLRAGYAGPLSLEVFNDSFRAAPARIMARDGLRSLVLAEAEARGAGLPPVPALDGVEFLEFAVDEEAGQELAAFLGTLGFRHAGHHRSKRVDLYRQGRVNLVLNQEQDSAASEHFLLHGPSVCGMGLRVDDARAALDRAQALLCPAWRETIGEGERAIPAVRAPDGTLVHLVQHDSGAPTIWDTDFHLFPAADEPGEFEAIDHVVQALPAGRMDGFVLFWRAVFGLQPQQHWETPDPYGLVKSRALVSPDGRLRIALNVSESRETSTGRFLSADAGPGVHHVAFRTGDVARALERLQPLGAPMLPIPANYYDDLAARWGLDEEALAGLQHLGLLYDRDDRGEFLHAYTEAFEERFFFEAVQRRDDYEGFGAVNAAVRAAAQARRHPARPSYA